MKIKASTIKIFKIKNRKGYAAVCRNYLTEGATIYQAYERMCKALRRGKIEISDRVVDIKKLLKAAV
jgi:hypothetical protein